MAGEGSRFSDGGFVVPKPLIPINGKPMIQWVINNLSCEQYDFTFFCIIRSKHDGEHGVAETLRSIDKRIEVVYTSELTDGPACTCLLVKDKICNQTPLLIANSDQFVEWNSGEFYSKCLEGGHDGCLLCFKIPPELNDTKWSYAKLCGNNVVDVQEKVVISDNATVGIYFWSKGEDFVTSAEAMIHDDIRVNGEFYVAPSYNIGISNDKKYSIDFCKRMWGLGVPSDLMKFEMNYLRKPRTTVIDMTYAYVYAFNQRDIQQLRKIFAPSITLTDNNGTFHGVSTVVEYLSDLFKLEIKLEISKIINSGNISVLTFDAITCEGKVIKGADVIRWSRDPVMTHLDGYTYEQ